MAVVNDIDWLRWLAIQVSLLLESEAEDLTMEFPITIATVPFRIPNSPNQPIISYGTFKPIILNDRNHRACWAAAMLLHGFFTIEID